ncbi:hybrid sensor histidine kinase/response regulator [Candidatus Nitronereus thalassa]|uniref:histidine kinase n=1 Tax=Candidatus Nitronereus thalassa TaxID=3020898 RepID=A0ABU3K9L5_9BACT|nr:response regulator [Candidatus Nitronereus thalassa]MDT7043139.1 response regulator [Candidatus Nitronereus thalassa]
MSRFKPLYPKPSFQPFGQLEPSHPRFQLLIEQNIDGMVIVGSDRTIRFVNPAAEAIFGKTWVDLVGAEFDFPLVVGETSEINFVTPAGQSLQAEMRIVEIDWEEESAYLASLRDITFRKIAEEERKRAEVQMQQVQKLESLGVLAGGIAHDFNNLLMTIVAHAGLAAKKMPLDSPGREHLIKIEQAALRGGELANQMLTYAGRGKPLIQAIHVSTLVEEMGHLLAVSISKRISLLYDLAKSLPMIHVDPAQMRQVVMNLIINASEAIGERMGTITLRTGKMLITEDYLRECHVRGDFKDKTCVFLEVVDTGHGIDTETLEKIFDPFFTTKFAGRGLGLAALLGIVRSHDGAIKVSSELGKGTAFRIILPSTPGTENTLERHAAKQETPSGKGTILVVDDEEDVRLAAQLILEDTGYQVICASDGLAGLDLFRQHHQTIRAVLLDLTMPRMNGEELFSEIQQIRQDIPVVLSSGYSEEEAVRQFTGKSFNAFIQKPYQIDSLIEKIKYVLDKSEAKKPS